MGLEILPYHTMGINKYKNMGKEYPLEGVPEMKPEQAKESAYDHIESNTGSEEKFVGISPFSLCYNKMSGKTRGNPQAS